MHIIGIDFRVLFFYICSVISIFVNENSFAIVIEGFPEKGFVGEAEDKEITRRRAFSKHIRDRF